MSTDEAARRILRLLNTSLVETADVEALDWSGILRRENGLSSGEHTIVGIARSVWNGSGGATVADLLNLDARNFAAVLEILAEYRDVTLVTALTYPTS